MSNQLETATQLLLEPTGLGDNELVQTLNRVMGPQIDYGDLYFQYSQHESWSMDEGTVKSGNYGIDQGVGIRAVSGEKTGFAYSDEIQFSALTDAAEAAKSIARNSGDTNRIRIRKKDQQIQRLYQPFNPLESMKDGDKVALLKEVEETARNLDARVSQVAG